MTPSSVLAFTAFAALLTITPGLDSVLVLRTAAARGPKPAYAAGVGVCMGVLIWAVAGGLGISALLTASRTAYDVLRIVGAAYLALLGGRLLVRSFRPASLDGGEPPVGPGVSAWSALRTGLATNLLNPKVGVFYLSVLPQFLPAGDAALGAAALGGIHAAEGMLWFGLLILTVGRVGSWLRRPVVARWLDRVVGLAFLGFGARLWFSHAR
jgi:threonine/homoserine/homoserine lactone efflux protein